MGVIHKLTDDVVTFIIEHKQNNPSIGVRKLAEITSEKFKTKVSKSSVSTILKNAELSSSVGRRPGGSEKPEKFKIPPNRKVEISKNMKKAGFVKDEPPKESPAKKTPVKKPKVTTPKKDEKVPKAESGPDTVPLIPDPVVQKPKTKKQDETIIGTTKKSERAGYAEFHKRVEALRAQQKERKAESKKGMGYVLLKAAQWETTGASLMSELLKKHVSDSDQETFIPACEMYLYLRALGAKSFDQTTEYRDHGLWQLNKLNEQDPDENAVRMKLKDLFSWEEGLEESTALNIAVEYGLENAQARNQVGGFEFILEEGAKLAFDTFLSKLEFGQPAPINRAMTWLSHYLISNVESPALYTVRGDQKFDAVFFTMISVFENLSGKKITRAVVTDELKREIADFTTIPAQQRTFMIGALPEQKEFAELTKNVKWSGKIPYYHEPSDRVVFFGETRSNYFSGRLPDIKDDYRVIALWKEGEDDPFWAIITNIREAQGKDIVATYMSRWPYFGTNEGNPAVSRPVSDGAPPEHKKIKFQDIFQDYISELSRFCKKNYFPSNFAEIKPNDMSRVIYDLSGTCYESDSYISIILDIPEKSPYEQDLLYAIKTINERHILDPKGRKIWLKR